MNKSSSGFKLTTVIFAVLIMAVSAMLSNAAISSETEIVSEQ